MLLLLLMMVEAVDAVYENWRISPIASTTLIAKVCRVFYRNFIFRHLLYVAKGTEIVLELKFT